MGKTSSIVALEDWSNRNPELHYIPGYFIRKIDGKEFTVSYFPVYEFFTLTLPDNTSISDYLDEIEDRWILYANLDEKGEILEWLREIRAKQSKLYQENNVHVIRFEVSGVEYRLRADTHWKSAKLSVGRQIYEFEENDLYLLNPDVPLLKDGLLNKILRSKLEKFGFNLPPTPYEPVLLLSTSELSAGVKQNDNDVST